MALTINQALSAIEVFNYDAEDAEIILKRGDEKTTGAWDSSEILPHIDRRCKALNISFGEHEVKIWAVLDEKHEAVRKE